MTDDEYARRMRMVADGLGGNDDDTLMTMVDAIRLGCLQHGAAETLKAISENVSALPEMILSCAIATIETELYARQKKREKVKV